MISAAYRSQLRTTLSVTMVVVAYIIAAGLSTAEQRQLGAHEHGTAALNVAISDSTLSIEFTAPAANLVGFEHAANTEDQTGAIAQAEEILGSGDMLVVPKTAECKLIASSVKHEIEREHVEHEKEYANHEHDGHEKEHEGEEEGHSEFHVLLTYDCRNIEALTHIDVKIFLLFPGNKEIHTQVITSTGQSGGELTPDAPRLVLP